MWDLNWQLKYHQAIQILNQSESTSFLEKRLKENEFKVPFSALKTNKSPGNDKLRVNITRKLYHELKIPLMNIFSLSLKKRSFS